MTHYKIIKISKDAPTEEIIHKAIPSIPTAKIILESMELAFLAAGEIIESYGMGFALAAPRQGVKAIYRIEQGYIN